VYSLQRSELAIVIPAYNEMLTIEAVVKSVSVYGQAIVVDDCSSDATAELALSKGAIVLFHKKNLGYDSALNTGFKEASNLGFSYVVTFDADGQHDAEIIRKYIEYFEKGYDLVLGNRPSTARLFEYLFSVYSKYRFGLLDPLCGMKGYNISLFNEYGCFDSYRSIGTELTFYSVKSGCKVIQVPIPIYQRVDIPRIGSNFKTNIKIFRALFIGMFK